MRLEALDVTSIGSHLDGCDALSFFVVVSVLIRATELEDLAHRARTAGALDDVLFGDAARTELQASHLNGAAELVRKRRAPHPLLRVAHSFWPAHRRDDLGVVQAVPLPLDRLW